MQNSEFKLILEDISEKLTVLIEAQNLLIRKLDRDSEENRLRLKRMGILDAAEKTYTETKRKPDFIWGKRR
jgi:hypothetical protein